MSQVSFLGMRMDVQSSQRPGSGWLVQVQVYPSSAQEMGVRENLGAGVIWLNASVDMDGVIEFRVGNGFRAGPAGIGRQGRGTERSILETCPQLLEELKVLL